MTALRLDPRAKLAMLLLCVLCAMLAPSLYFQFALVTLIGVLAALSGRWRYAVKGVAAYALICLFTVWCMGVMTGVWRTMFVAFLGLLHKVYACGMLAGVVIATTRVNEFLSAMARLRVPKKLTIPIAVMLRYLPTIREDWRMALAALITLPLGMVFFALMMAGYEKNYACTVVATNALNDAAVEYIGGIEVIKVFGKARSSYEKFVAAARACARSYIDWMNRRNFHFTFAINIMPATLLTVLPIGGALVRAGTLAPEKFVLIVRLSMGLITPPIGCMKFTDDLAKVGTVIGEVTAILTAPELSRPETDTETPQGSTVALRDVHFGYGEKEVLHGVSLTFREGTVNAMVGPSGSGKSTIAKLIAAFWDVNSGSITLGGADIRNISADHYHRLVAYVSQDNFLFDATVRENIRMGRPGATDAEVEQAARDCGCYDFIMGLERGGSTPRWAAGEAISPAASGSGCPSPGP